MEGTVIYVKLNKGQLEYRDSDGQEGSSISTHAKHNQKITWKLDKCSGISEITGVKIKGDLGIINGKPRKIDFNQWEVYSSGEGEDEGELSYTVDIIKCKNLKDEEVESQGLRDTNPPLIRVP
ncbi:MAG: hypothetical protein GXY94_12660 [Bacteroidales bacterium]|jgi:hypothetical protein|nr:hypothetical protein [Bacteroidales bacterium]